MHEVSLGEEVLRIVEESSHVEGFTKVSRLTLEIGQLACVEPEALEFALNHMGKGTPMEGAEIVFLQIAGSAFCEVCLRRVPLEFALSPCPQCGHYPLSDIEGTELRIRDLEVL